MRQPAPAYVITLDGRDLTSNIAPRLQNLSISECRADEADTLDITLDDSDGALVIPRRGAVLSVSIGWAGQLMVNKGTYKVDEVEHSGAPDTITLRARSASMTKGLSERTERSWHNETLGAIVRKIAGKHKLDPRVADAIGKILIPHIDQTNESDMSFLTRLAKRYDAVMNVKDAHLLFMPIGEARTASGKSLQSLTLTRRDGDQHRYHIAERESYEGVRAWYHTNGKGNREPVIFGGESKNGIKVLPETYPTKAEALAAAEAEYKRIQRNQATMDLTLALGRADIFPELPVTLTGWKPEINETPWLVKKVRHSIADGGFTTALELETRDAAAAV